MSSAADRDADIRARIQQHWEASERGDVDAEHETRYFADPFDAPPGRATLAEPIPPREG